MSNDRHNPNVELIGQGVANFFFNVRRTAREQPSQLMHQAEFEEVVGKQNICDNVQEALKKGRGSVRRPGGHKPGEYRGWR